MLLQAHQASARENATPNKPSPIIIRFRRKCATTTNSREPALSAVKCRPVALGIARFSEKPIPDDAHAHNNFFLLFPVPPVRSVLHAIPIEIAVFAVVVVIPKCPLLLVRDQPRKRRGEEAFDAPSLLITYYVTGEVKWEGSSSSSTHPTTFLFFLPSLLLLAYADHRPVFLPNPHAPAGSQWSKPSTAPVFVLGMIERQ